MLAFLFNMMGKAAYIKDILAEIDDDYKNQYYADIFVQYGKMTQAVFLDFNLNDLQNALMPRIVVGTSLKNENILKDDTQAITEEKN